MARAGDRARPAGRHRACSTAPRRGTSATRPSTGTAASFRSAAGSSSPATGRAITSTRRATGATSPSGAYEPHFWATLCRHFGREDFIPDQFSEARRDEILGFFERRVPREDDGRVDGRAGQQGHLLRAGAESRGSLRRPAAAPPRHGGRDGHARPDRGATSGRRSSSRTRRPRCARRRPRSASTPTRCCAVSATRAGDIAALRDRRASSHDRPDGGFRHGTSDRQRRPRGRGPRVHGPDAGALPGQDPASPEAGRARRSTSRAAPTRSRAGRARAAAPRRACASTAVPIR